MDKLEATYNRSTNAQHNLPWPAHRSLLKPLTDSVHIRRTLIQRYLSFISSIEKSKKKPLILQSLSLRKKIPVEASLIILPGLIFYMRLLNIVTLLV